MGRINGHLIAGGITVFNREIVIFQVDVEIGVDEFFADIVPDDAGHLIAVEFNNRIFNLDFLHDENLAFELGCAML